MEAAVALCPTAQLPQPPGFDLYYRLCQQCAASPAAEAAAAERLLLLAAAGVRCDCHTCASRAAGDAGLPELGQQAVRDE